MPKHAESATNSAWRVAPETASSIFVGFGALAVFVGLTADYYGVSSNQSMGAGQIALMAFGGASISAGYGLDIIGGRLTVHDAGRLLAIAVQLALLGMGLHFYHIENRAFDDIVFPLAALGFVVNDRLRPAWRLPFFFALSVGAVVAVLGFANPVACLCLIGFAFGLFAVCNLPIPIVWRVLLLVVIGAAFAALRIGWVKNEAISSILPILAAMFMFRAAIYLYDVSNNKGPKNFWQRLSYFFLLTNVVFPFFPAVDFATFGRTYYNQDALRIYQRGVDWILRGLIHLLIYRFVYLHLVMSADGVHDALGLLQFITANFALYFRVSGLFHLIVGILLLFGFNLPETHTRFYLTNSFVDFWRRINIYWKDFMQKMVFNPVYTGLKRRGVKHQTGIVISMLSVFVGTWALHAYQWFWLRGSVLLTPQDILFWAILGLLLVAQTLWESRQRPSAARAKMSPLGVQILLVARTICSMLTICILWSLWTCDSIGTWLGMWSSSGLAPALAAPGSATPAQWGMTLVSIAAVAAATAVTAGFLLPFPPAAVRARSQSKIVQPANRLSSTVVVSVCTIGLLIAQAPPLQRLLTPEVREFTQDMSSSRLNSKDQALLERGYYENLTDVNRFNTRLWEIYMQRPRGVAEIRDMAAVRLLPNYLEYEFIPGASASFNNVTYNINRWGMRDRDTSLEKPGNTYRIALLGASRSVGWGVNYADGFEPRLEGLLNADQDSSGQHYEILNFSVDGYVPVQRLMTLEQRAWQFEPDAVFYEAGPPDASVGRFARLAHMGRESPYPELNEILKEAGVQSTMSEAEIESRLAPYRYQLLEHIYERFVADCRAHGIKPTWIYIDDVSEADPYRTQRFEEMETLARKTGFEIMDLSQVLAGRDLSSLRIAAWDDHPNATGHALLAKAMYDRLRAANATFLQPRQDAVRGGAGAGLDHQEAN